MTETYIREQTCHRVLSSYLKGGKRHICETLSRPARSDICPIGFDPAVQPMRFLNVELGSFEINSWKRHVNGNLYC